MHKNSINNVVFLGFAADLPSRFNRHIAELTIGCHRNKELQNLWNSYGESVLKFKVLDELTYDNNINTHYLEELNILAEMWLHKLEKSGDSIIFIKNK